MEIISVNIQKGGSGKTTSVQAIAEILNRDYGKKVLCIDLDPQCNLTTVSGIDIMQYQDNNMYTLLKERLSGAAYDYILIDTPPALGLLNVMSLTASTKVIIPTECSYLSMIGLNQLYELIGTVRKYSNKELQIAGVLLIKYSPRLKLNVEVASGLEQMAARMGIKVFNSKIRETVKIKEAQSQQVPLLDWDSSNSAVSDYISFVKELI